MPSFAALFMRMQLFLTKPFTRFIGIPTARKAQDQLGRITMRTLKESVEYKDIPFERFMASFAKPKERQETSKGVILYLHGGGYTAGGLDYCKAFGGVLAAASGLDTLCVAYRLAPEHRFPAALDDAMAAYDYLLEKGCRPNQIIVAGESAGGGLCFGLGLRLKAEGKDLPAGFIGMSPWADLTLSGKSYQNNLRRDPTMRREYLAYNVIMYAAGHEDEAFASPIFGDFDGFPPCLLLAGSEEILLDDARTLHQRLLDGGSKSELIIEKGLWHVYPLYGLPESRKAMACMVAFIRGRLEE